MNNPPSEYLIDTSVLITYLRGNRDIVARLDATATQFTSPVVIAELAYGALRSRDPIRAMNGVQALIGPMPVLEIDATIGYDFAEIKNALTATNQLIPDNDIWIAVTAMAYDVALIARDAHFSRLIPYGLTLDLW